VSRSDRAAAFAALVQSGIPVGVLAYHDGTPVGWCSIGPRPTLVALRGGSSPPGLEAGRTWAVTCFFVDPRRRREGISVRLLRAAVEYARSEGAKVVEGYPVEPRRDPLSSMGSPSTFRRAGFLDVAPHGLTRHVMRNVVR
jgi:GNAT superfamily N-acetyltransferase